MNADTIRKLINRFKQKDLNIIVDNWSAVRTRNIDVSAFAGLATKRKFVNAIIKFVQPKSVTVHEAAELDLLYVSECSSSRRWNTYRMVKMPGSSCSVGLSAKNIEHRLRAELQKFKLHSEIFAYLKDGIHWIRMEVSDKKLNSVTVNGAVYVVSYTGIPYLCIANLKATYADIIIQIFVSMCGCRELEKMGLEGRCVRSLISLVLGRHGQGLSEHTELLKTNRKRKKDGDENDLHEELDERIQDENWREKRRCKDFVSTHFGEGPQPTLEFLEYRLETKFAGGVHAPRVPNSELFHCTVRFEGTNVLKGITQLVSAGLATLPLPNHLANIKSLERNRIMLRTKAVANNE